MCLSLLSSSQEKNGKMTKCAKKQVQQLSGKTVALLHSDGTLEENVPVESLKAIEDADTGNGK